MSFRAGVRGFHYYKNTDSQPKTNVWIVLLKQNPVRLLREQVMPEERRENSGHGHFSTCKMFRKLRCTNYCITEVNIVLRIPSCTVGLEIP